MTILVYPVDFDRQFNVTRTHPMDLPNNDATGGDSAAAVGKLSSRHANTSYLLQNILNYDSLQSESLI
jgi:hypothetical protein